jgi:hypothetical protein
VQNVEMNSFKQIYDPAYLTGGELEVACKKHGTHDQWKEKKVFKFTWEYCGTCRGMFVRCPMCGNNCCNATFGKVTEDFQPTDWREDAKDCPVCNLAYQFQHLAYETKKAPKKPSKKVCQRIEKEADAALNAIFDVDETRK